MPKLDIFPGMSILGEFLGIIVGLSRSQCTNLNFVGMIFDSLGTEMDISLGQYVSATRSGCFRPRGPYFQKFAFFHNIHNVI